MVQDSRDVIRPCSNRFANAVTGVRETVQRVDDASLGGLPVGSYGWYSCRWIHPFQMPVVIIDEDLCRQICCTLCRWVPCDDVILDGSSTRSSCHYLYEVEASSRAGSEAGTMNYLGIAPTRDQSEAVYLGTRDNTVLLELDIVYAGCWCPSVGQCILPVLTTRVTEYIVTAVMGGHCLDVKVSVDHGLRLELSHSSDLVVDVSDF